MSQLIAQYGYTLHNGRSSMITFNTSSRSRGMVTVIRSTTGMAELLTKEETRELVNELTDLGFDLKYTFGFKVAAEVTMEIIPIIEGGVHLSLTGSICLFSGHVGFPIDLMVKAACMEDAKAEVFEFFNKKYSKKVKVTDTEGKALVFGTEPKQKAALAPCPF